MTDDAQFGALLHDTRAILARHDLARHSGQPFPIRFACAFPAHQAAPALNWLRTQPRQFDEDWTLLPFSDRQADITLTRHMPADAEQIARTELMLHQAATLFEGTSPGWEIGPIALTDNPAAPSVPPEATGVGVFDSDPDFAALLERNKHQLATLNLSARRLNDIRISSRFSQIGPAKAAIAAFNARFTIPQGIQFSTETLRYSPDDVRISLLVNLESRRPDPILITRYQLMLRDAALAFGGSPPDWIHNDWRRR